MTSRVRNPLMVAYGIIVLVMVVGFYRVESINHDLEREVVLRQDATCAAYDQLENILAQLVNQTARPTSTTQERIDDPELAQLLEDSRERNERFRQHANTLLEEAECPLFPVEGQ